MIRLTKSFMTPHGIPLLNTVWRWIELRIDIKEQTCWVVLGCFPNKDVADKYGVEELQPIARKMVSLSGQAFKDLVNDLPEGDSLSEIVSNSVYEVALDYLKFCDEFKEAELI